MVIFLPCFVREGLGQCGSGWIMSVRQLRLLQGAALAMQGVFSCDISLVAYQKVAGDPCPKCDAA